ncbi:MULTISPECIES: sensor histidine kinase [unclassified Acinetobacter]|uniref:sensor histidine kinase n=1 Tax=unclassified Acinetobacter TaxID=196816 RepID=UPI0035B8D5DC
MPDTIDEPTLAQNDWRHWLELIISSNIFAVVLAIASRPHISELEALTVLGYMLFATWVAVSFACVSNYLQPHLRRMHKYVAMMFCFYVLLFILFLSNVALNAFAIVSQLNQTPFDISDLFKNSSRHLLLGGGAGLISIRYLYLREQWIVQQRAELLAKVQALQARIQPHFLFNSLNSVVSLIAIDPFKAEQLLIDLSRLFRASLTELKEVSLAEEVSLCQRYLKIEQVRLGERLQVKWRIDGENRLEQVHIPLLTLQPLLENAIYHGAESMSESGVVSIYIGIKDKSVDIVVTNTYQVKANKRTGHGMALDNVRQRLMVYYEDSLHFNASSQDGVFTVMLSYQYR